MIEKFLVTYLEARTDEKLVFKNDTAPLMKTEDLLDTADSKSYSVQPGEAFYHINRYGDNTELDMKI